MKYYAGRIAYWRKMGAPTPRLIPPRSGRCPRYLAKVLRAKSLAAKRAYLRWYAKNYRWELWLPDKFARVGACETGYGRRPGDWAWDSGRYVSAFGIYRAAYAQFAHAVGQLSWDETRSRLGRLPTPFEQYNVADAIRYRFGWSAWGCGGA